MTLDGAYSMSSAEEAKAFYDRWAADYEAEMAEHSYATPLRCAQALLEQVADPSAPLIELGCGTGLGGVALSEAGFSQIDGYDISADMLEQARAKDIYRALNHLDLSQPIELPEEIYVNAAAIGVLNPNHMPTTVIDEILKLLPVGGCFVFSLNDHSIAEGTMETRILELTEYNVADLIFKEHGDVLPGIELGGCVYVLKKR